MNESQSRGFKASDDHLTASEVVFRRHSRAQRYIVRVADSGDVVLTIPRGGTRRAALRFANQHRQWLREHQMLAWASLAEDKAIRAGDEILYRGLYVQLKVSKDRGRPIVRFADQKIFIADAGMDLRRPLLQRLKELARDELAERTRRLAEELRIRFARVVVRDQKTRWGSCSMNREISLNWRLILAPEATRDYIIVHELCHLRQMNHSSAFWRLVGKHCPEYKQHEAWLFEHQKDMWWG